LSIGSKIANALSLHRVTPIRRRYIWTRGGKLRLRYMILIPALLIAGGMELSGEWFSDFSIPKPDLSFASLSFNSATAREHDGSAEEQRLAMADTPPQTIQDKLSSGISQAAAILTAPPFKNERILTLDSGETLAGVLQEEGLSGRQAYYAIKALSDVYDPRKLRAGQTIDIEVAQNKNAPEEEGGKISEPLILKEMRLSLDPIEYVEVSYVQGNEYKAEKIKREIKRKKRAGYATIHTSVYGSAAKYGIPSGITAELIRVYSWDVDFQRDIRQGDTIEVLYETYETKRGDVAKFGEILYANLSVDGKDIPVYRFELKNGDVDYFTEDGWSIKKALMKTPIDGARLSSGYGMRFHPVLGYNKMHKGVDFAAPTGTPIYAAGDGTIEYAARKGGYGNYIRIRHNSTLKTAYAHMHRFAKGMGKGKRVKQGEVIGYVGTTGRSTGPHLHYEVLENNKQVNPNRVDLPVGEKLKSTNLANLKVHIKKMKREYKEIAESLELVKNTTDQSTQIQ